MNEVVKQKSGLTKEDLVALSNLILEKAKQKGASSAEVDIASNKGFSVTARNKDVETVEYHQDKSIDLTVYFGKRCGSVSLSDVRPEAIHDAVEAACHIAKFTDEDPASGLADKELMAFDYPELALSYPWDITVEHAKEIAIACEALAVSQDKRIHSAEEVAVATSHGTHVYANSHGFCGSFPYSRHETSCVLVAKENDQMQRDYSYTVAVDPKDLLSVETIANEAAHKVTQRLGARRLTTRKTPIIFAAEEARGLLGHFIGAIQGGRIYRKSSFLLDMIGEKVFPDFMNIHEEPHLPKGLGSMPFDDDGLPTTNNIFVDGGVLQKYATGIYSGRKLGIPSTGNAGGLHNVIVAHGNKDFKALLKEMGTGFVVVELMGQGVNMITGDYSRGASGYWVENGEIQFPVHEVTIAGSLKDIYQRIREVGADVDVRGNIRSGSILIEEMMLAGE